MAIIAKDSGGKDFLPAPPGAHAAVCVDVIDLGVLEVTYGGKTKKQHKIRIAWQIGEDMPDGRPFLVQKRYTLSLHEKAALRKDLESWRGRAFDPDELAGFDVETVIDAPCMVNVVHAPNPNGGNPYANVTSIMKLIKGVTPPKIRDYIRVIDREPKENGDEEQPPSWGQLSYEDIPF